MNMKATLVNVSPPHNSPRPSLSPELLAAVGARYSRNNEGLDSILAKIDINNPDASIDKIFSFISYGHASIADMAPVAIFMDGISVLLAFWLWYISPCASGQESSTRYIKYNVSSLMSVDDLSISSDDLYSIQANSFLCYEKALEFWENHGKNSPEAMNLPEDVSDAVRARLLRNYAFDRARVFLPLSAKTNVMMLQSARKWVDTVSFLLSSEVSEFVRLGEMLKQELSLAVPRLIKHMVPKESSTLIFREGVSKISRDIGDYRMVYGSNGGWSKVFCDFSSREDFERAHSELNQLKWRENRYAEFPQWTKMTPVTFGWKWAGFAEIRDLNRHRTGNKQLGTPNGFYCASDVAPIDFSSRLDIMGMKDMRKSFDVAKKYLQEGNFEGLYCLNLGHTFDFTHTTTLDKYIYEVELRTGIGTHYAYSRMMKETVEDDIRRKIPFIIERMDIGNSPLEW